MNVYKASHSANAICIWSSLGCMHWAWIARLWQWLMGESCCDTQKEWMCICYVLFVCELCVCMSVSYHMVYTWVSLSDSVAQLLCAGELPRITAWDRRHSSSLSASGGEDWYVIETAVLLAWTSCSVTYSLLFVCECHCHVMCVVSSRVSTLRLSCLVLTCVYHSGGLLWDETDCASDSSIWMLSSCSTSAVLRWNKLTSCSLFWTGLFTVWTQHVTVLDNIPDYMIHFFVNFARASVCYRDTWKNSCERNQLITGVPSWMPEPPLRRVSFGSKYLIRNQAVMMLWWGYQV